jgi:hypothetical protein
MLILLTSVDEGIDVFNFPKRWMITVRHQGLNRIQQTVHIYNRPTHTIIILARRTMSIKETVSRDFRPSVFFFINQSTLVHRLPVTGYIIFAYVCKFADSRKYKYRKLRAV